MYPILIYNRYGRSLKMLEQIFKLSVFQLSVVYTFFVISSIFGASLMYIFLKYILKNMLEQKALSFQLQTNEIVDIYLNGVKDIKDDIDNIQNITIDKFVNINKTLIDLNEILVFFKENQIKVKVLENEIIKYKKIIKRMEKKQ